MPDRRNPRCTPVVKGPARWQSGLHRGPEPATSSGMSDILCIGSVLWDVIGRSAGHMRPGADVPGRITRHPGGVAFNIALTLLRFGMRPALLSVLGRDPQGDELAL